MEPFKNLFNDKLVAGMARHFAKAWPEFDQDGFREHATRGLGDLELKERSNRIEEALDAYLPGPFPRAAEILLAGLHPAEEPGVNGTGIDEQGIRGWAILPMSGYVGRLGQPHFELSMRLMKEMTKRFTSEFGIRYFLLEQPGRTLETLAGWTGDDNVHVRRLVSEGTRPRLPWAMRLPEFIGDPSPLLPLLDALKDDPEEYVRRSVANHLNDISKDHPDLIAGIAREWLAGAADERQRLVRHALRTLIKQGHTGALSALGYAEPEIECSQPLVHTPVVRLGQALEFEVSVTSTAENDQPLIVDYAVHHRKANDSTSPKVFKWKRLTLAGGETVELFRRHPMRPVTTRVYYPGLHHLEITINGKTVARADFILET